MLIHTKPCRTIFVEQEFKNNEALNDHIDREVHTITKAPDLGAFFCNFTRYIIVHIFLKIIFVKDLMALSENETHNQDTARILYSADIVQTE